MRAAEVTVGGANHPVNTRNDNVPQMAGSVDDADAVLARFGYVDAEPILA